jgi:hypothetical protein
MNFEHPQAPIDGRSSKPLEYARPAAAPGKSARVILGWNQNRRTTL